MDLLGLAMIDRGDRPSNAALDLTSDETAALIKMVRARIRLKQAFSESHPDLTILVAKLLNWSHNVGPGTQRGGEK